MRIVFASSEAVPFAKTGGLADVCGALPVEIARLGHETTLFLPAYHTAVRCGQPIEPTNIRLHIPIGSKVVEGRLLKSQLPGSKVTVYLVEQNEYFDRPQLYQESGVDFVDNCERFVFFCRSVLDSIRMLDMSVDVVHAHDWQTALLAAYLKTEYRGVPQLERAVSLFTIHNLSYQGVFWHWDMLLTGLDWKYFNWHQMEFFGKLNLMKTGLVFADMLNTVSPRYAEEIQSAPLGCGLEGVLQSRRDMLAGITNGVDYRLWDPSSDPHLPHKYDVEHFADGKAKCKAALQQELGLAVDPAMPLVGIIGRLVEQKGLDLITALLPEWLAQNKAQWVFLGTGDPKYHDVLARLARQHPTRCAVRLEFSEPLAHRIEAGADMFLMPSRFEPCGLNQLYSLRYGTVPVVRATGGLANTVVDATPEALASGTATGFAFQQYSVLALNEALERACRMFADRTAWSQLVSAGMRQDWSWARSAREYVSLYQRALSRSAQTQLSAN